MNADSGIEAAAKRDCDWLLQSSAAKKLTRAEAEGLVILAFTVGAAWALDCPDMVTLARAQHEAIVAKRNAGGRDG